jgi:RNA polymerase sigma-70 factor (ECF subfamily)
MDDVLGDFDTIYAIYHPKILRYLTRLVGEDEAEDLAQEVFIKASQALPGFRGESSLSTWLYRIATNHAYDRIRSPAFRWKVRGISLDGNAEKGVDGIAACNPFTGEKTPAAEQQLVRQELNACLMSYIEQLPENYRIVLLLSDMETLTNQEIAEILGITLETVKIRLHRARAQIREMLLSRCEYYWVSELGWHVN